MPEFKGIASDHTLDDKERKRLFYRLYVNDLGCFWNVLERYDPYGNSEIANKAMYGDYMGDIFPAITKIIRKKKMRDHFTIPTNYVFSISEKIAQSVMGTGIKVKIDPNNDDYTEWYQKTDMDLRISTQLQEAVAVGAAGIRFGYSEDTLVPMSFAFDNYFPRPDSDFFVYQIQTEHCKKLKAENKQLIYVVHVVPTEEGEYLQRHNVYETPLHKPLEFLRERRDVFDEMFEDVSVDDEGFETNDAGGRFVYPVKPFVLLTSGRYTNLTPISLFNDVISSIQALWVYDTMTFLEIETNFLSKLLLPENMFSIDPSTGTRKNLESRSFIPINPNTQSNIEPKYLTKDMTGPAEVVRQHKKSLKNQIAQSVGIPVRFLDETSDQKLEAVGVARIDLKNFDNKIKNLQSQVESVVRHIQALWFGISSLETPTATFTFESVFPQTIEKQQFFLDMHSAGVASLFDTLSDIFPDETEEEINGRIERLEEDRTQQTATIQATANVADITNLL